MIQAEIKDAWEDDRTRAAMLINASADSHAREIMNVLRFNSCQNRVS